MTFPEHRYPWTLGLILIATVSCGGGSSSVNGAGATPNGGRSGSQVRPGSGFQSATPVPPPYGNDTQKRAKAIAAWDYVPYQTASDHLDVGLLAFSGYGIDRVEFSADGSPFVPIRTPSVNPRTGVFEYWARVRLQNIMRGTVEVRAIVYPQRGAPRVLRGAVISLTSSALNNQTIYVASSGNDTWPGSQQFPKKTVTAALAQVADGGTVIITEKGTYSVSSVRRTNVKWITVTASASLRRNEVVVVGDPAASNILRPAVHRLKWQGISFDFARISQYYPEDSDYVWFEDVHWFDSLGWTHRIMTTLREGPFHAYATNSLAENMLTGFVNFDLIRNCEVRNISGDAYNLSKVIIGSKAINVRGGIVPGWHTDVLQYYGQVENLIIYDFQAYNCSSQILFLFGNNSSYSNCAFVNIFGDTGGLKNAPPFSQIATPHSHTLFYNISLLDQTFVIRNDFRPGNQFTAENVFIRNCAFYALKAGTGSVANIPGLTIENNHFVASAPVGTSASTGSVYHIVDRAGSRFRYAGDAAGRLIGSGIPIKSVGGPLPPHKGAFLRQ